MEILCTTQDTVTSHLLLTGRLFRAGMNNGSLRKNHIFIRHKLAAAGHIVADILNPEHFNFSCGSGSTLTSRTFSHFVKHCKIFRHCLYFLREQWMDLNGKMRWLVSEWVQRGLLGLGRGIRSLEELCWLGLGKVVKLIFIDIQWFGHDRLDLSGACLACKTNSFPSYMFYRQNICKKEIVQL